MIRLGFIREDDYGRRLAEEYICRRGMSKRNAVMKLREKGFDGELAASLADSVEYNPTESINKILSAKYHELPGGRGRTAKNVRYALSQGIFCIRDICCDR